MGVTERSLWCVENLLHPHSLCFLLHVSFCHAEPSENKNLLWLVTNSPAQNCRGTQGRVPGTLPATLELWNHNTTLSHSHWRLSSDLKVNIYTMDTNRIPKSLWSKLGLYQEWKGFYYYYELGQAWATWAKALDATAHTIQTLFSIPTPRIISVNEICTNSTSLTYRETEACCH